MNKITKAKQFFVLEFTFYYVKMFYFKRVLGLPCIRLTFLLSLKQKFHEFQLILA